MNLDHDIIPKTFEPKEAENKWYQIWEKEGCFKPQGKKESPSHCIIMPPPNVTGRLHMGHALDVVTQDIPTRFKRMKGFRTLWLPGMDHAGIATQTKVEALIFENEGKTKHDLSREEFLAKIWEWKNEYGGIINQQQRKIGASCDWDYFLFTMDPTANEAVNHAFVKWFNEGLIYQAEYIINWDPKLQSAISDAEVDHKEVEGAFYHLLYSVKNSSEKIEVATTRPETLLGDTAVAVNPQDDRFKHLIGKTAIVPLCLREVPIIADDHVDMETGTGCLKVTPGHDFNDFEIGKRHNLKFINILNKDGTLNDYGMEFSGLSSSKARKKIVEKLEGLGLLVKTLPHKQQVGHGERTGAVIEPLISKQWFLNTKKMSQRAMSAVENDLTKFIPKSWENTYFSWLRDPRDWCISRQLIWGHQIPIYSCESCHHQWALEIKPQDCPQCHSKLFIQDPDVLDTWFSSGLWPLSTLGWPDKNRMESKKFSTFFPTTTLVTGFDIIFFWVVRMMMMSLDLTNQVPFKNVYIHAIVRDKLGRKMSKSLNNGIEPLEVIEQYGADALRFTLAAGSGYNRNINLDPARIEGFRNFINKIWNAFRFIYPHIQNGKNDQAFSSNLHHHEKWILTELNLVVKSVDHSIEEYRFDEACSALYSFIYDSFCGYFIELSKTVFYSDQVEGEKEQRAKVIKYVFREIVKLLHPICPFITEELWSHLKDPKENFLILQDFPTNKKEYDFLEDQKSMNIFIEVITKIRNLRFSVNLKPKDEIVVHLFSNDKILEKYFNENQKFFSDLARVKNIITGTRGVSQKPAKSIMAATSHTDIYIPLEGFIDIDDQIAKIKKELVVTELECQKFDKKINNPDFVAKAKPEAIDAAQQKHQELSEKIQSLKDGLKLFS